MSLSYSSPFQLLEVLLLSVEGVDTADAIVITVQGGEDGGPGVCSALKEYCFHQLYSYLQCICRTDFFFSAQLTDGPNC